MTCSGWRRRRRDGAHDGAVRRSDSRTMSTSAVRFAALDVADVRHPRALRVAAPWRCLTRHRRLYGRISWATIEATRRTERTPYVDKHTILIHIGHTERRKSEWTVCHKCAYTKISLRYLLLNSKLYPPVQVEGPTPTSIVSGRVSNRNQCASRSHE